MKLKLIIFVSMIIGISTMSAVGQKKTDVKIDDVIINNNLTDQEIKDYGLPSSFNGIVVEVILSKEFAKSDLVSIQTPGNYQLINMSQKKFVNVSQVIPDDVTYDSIYLVIANRNLIKQSEVIHLYAFNLLFNGKSPKSRLEGKARFKDSDITSTEYKLEPTSTKDDSDIYVSYQLNVVRDKADTGSADIKVKIPIPVNNKFPLGSKRSQTIAPFFELKADSNAKADPDSLKFGVDWRFKPTETKGKGSDPMLVYMAKEAQWSNSGFVEAPKNFDTINAIWGSRMIFTTRDLIEGGGGKLHFQPFFGTEIGRNLKSTFDEAEGKGIFRLLYGAEIGATKELNLGGLVTGVGFNASYIRRHPLVNELGVENQENAPPKLISFGKGPKDHLKAKFLININKLFSPFVEWERGRVPPNYNFVDHKWKLGLLFRSKVKTK